MCTECEDAKITTVWDNYQLAPSGYAKVIYAQWLCKECNEHWITESKFIDHIVGYTKGRRMSEDELRHIPCAYRSF